MGYKKDMSRYENLEGLERCSLADQLERWAEKYAGKTAVVDSEQKVTYRELNERVSRMARAFLCNGIHEGDRVVVQLPNKLTFVIVFFALMRIGAVPIMMLPAHREAELEGIIKLAEPTAYVVAGALSRLSVCRYGACDEKEIRMPEKYFCGRRTGRRL